MGDRIPNRGLVYLRRSGKRQETSLDTQLTWAIHEALQLGVTTDATPADLQYMRDNSLHSYKSLRIDDGVSGSDATRPGFKALIHDSVSDRSISHIFGFRRDRLFRPEEPIEALQTEKTLSRAGVTIVFSTEIVPPRQRGKRDLAKDIGVLLEYNEAGAFCEQLAERMILTHKSLAAKGFSTGGNPPYGHVRGLFGPAGKLVEILAQGRT
jgi:DNA invertase Pin-like site-specific DNA recombinase